MKKLLYVLTGLLLAAFILPSCSSSLSITKRRYNKGYYVHQVKARQNQAKSSAHEKNRHEKMAKNDRKASQTEVLRATDLVVKDNSVQKSSAIPVTASAADLYSPSEKQALRDFKDRTGAAPVELAVRKPVKALKEAIVLTREAAQKEEALSLLWILIVIVLVVYILGLIMDGFGLGELIHILGVVIVALLILWLLRIL